MMVLVFWVMGILLITTQTTLLAYFPSWLGCPDLLFILIIYISYRFAWVPGMFLVFSLSWTMDVVASVYMGLYPLLCLLSFAALKALTTKSPIKESTYQIPLVGVSYFVLQVAFYLINTLFFPEMLPAWVWRTAAQQTLLVLLSSIPLFIIFNRIYDYLQQRRLRRKTPRRHVRRTA